VPGVEQGDQRQGHDQGDARLGEHPGGLRRHVGDPGRRDRGRRRRRGLRAARARRGHPGGGAQARGQRGRQARAPGRGRAGPGHVRDARTAGARRSAVHRLTMQRVALIGYGEVGKILAEDLRAAGVQVRAWDLALATGGEPRGDAMRAHADAHGVVPGRDAADAVAGARLVVSAVTASRTLDAARACLAGLQAGAFFLDLNRASPGTKREAAAAVDGAGARYVEGAVMTSVPPHRIKVPLLLGGPHARALEAPLQALGFAARFHDERLGVASATKMCRSVVIKGLEALVVESLAAAREYGVEDAVLASLEETFPGIDWQAQASYFFRRVIEHGRRRSEEMREVARTVAEAGLEPWTAEAAARRQARMAELADAGAFGERGQPGFARSPDWRTEADRLRAACTSRGTR